jgi:hypothetical protein
MREAGSGNAEAGSGELESGGGERKSGGQPQPFAQVMAEQGMAAPNALAESMHRATAGRNASLTDAQQILVAAENLLDQVLDGACESRESALDLLTVDALVTRAMEMAARDPNSLAQFPEQAMNRIAAR